MRKLTIERRKRFAGSAAVVKFYIEDAENEELRIDQVPCRKLGQLKNGETQTFSISNDSAKLFAIHDKLSKEYCNDSYQLPTSGEDIFLSGEAKINPGIGNTFVFDGNTTVLTPKKKRGRIIGWVLLVVAILIGSVIGRITGGFVGDWIGSTFLSDDEEEAQPKTFSVQGMNITLTDAFSEESHEKFTACFSSRRIAILCTKEPFSLMPGLENYTLEQYGQLALQNNGMTDFQLQTHEGVTFFEYEAETDNGTFYYLCTLHKAVDSFWMVQFAVQADQADDYLPDLFTWAKSISFSA